jgi:hypothetical protein
MTGLKSRPSSVGTLEFVFIKSLLIRKKSFRHLEAFFEGPKALFANGLWQKMPLRYINNFLRVNLYFKIFYFILVIFSIELTSG